MLKTYSNLLEVVVVAAVQRNSTVQQQGEKLHKGLPFHFHFPLRQFSAKPFRALCESMILIKWRGSDLTACSNSSSSFDVVLVALRVAQIHNLQPAQYHEVFALQT